MIEILICLRNKVIMMLQKCVRCGGKLEKKKLDYALAGVNLGKFPAWVCGQCREQYFDEETANRMTEAARAKGVFGLAKT